MIFAKSTRRVFYMDVSFADDEIATAKRPSLLSFARSCCTYYDGMLCIDYWRQRKSHAAFYRNRSEFRSRADGARFADCIGHEQCYLKSSSRVRKLYALQRNGRSGSPASDKTYPSCWEDHCSAPCKSRIGPAFRQSHIIRRQHVLFGANADEFPDPCP